MVLVVGCSSTIKNNNSLGKVFPQVQGKSLFGDSISVPQKVNDYQVILIGYKQNTQFDIDRWLIGLEMTGVKVLVNELPVLDSWFPFWFRNKIDGGMKRGIPEGLWKNVITVYDDAQIIKNFLGTENPNNARVILLDAEHKVLAHFDDGFSSKSLSTILKFIPKNKKSSCGQLF